MKRAITFGLIFLVAVACGSEDGREGFDDPAQTVDPTKDPGNFGDSGTGESDSGTCVSCSADGHDVIGCDGKVMTHCPPNLRCGGGTCLPPCDAAKANKSSVGCDYYAKAMLGMGGSFGGCFVSFVANTYDEPVHLNATFAGKALDLAKFAKLPKGAGKSVTYEPYNATTGLLPNEVAILFLANDPVVHGSMTAGVACPVPAAVGLIAQTAHAFNVNTEITNTFHITTDRPVVAYQMMPYGGGRAASTGASLLLPTSAWDTNYIAVAAYKPALFQGIKLPPTTAILASEDGTVVTLLPNSTINVGYGVPAGIVNQQLTVTLNKGEAVEFVQNDDLTGSPVKANKPIGLIAGHMGLRVPEAADYSDHAEQQIPPVRALGSEYVGIGPRDRVPGIPEKRLYRIVGAAAGTKLTYEPSVPGAPAQIGLGQVLELTSDTPFVIKSQDASHPFVFVTYMSGSGALNERGAPAGYGDADFVRLVAGLQFLQKYVFFTDPTYPETNLVVVRRKGASGFADVTLDCAGTLTGWAPVGTGSQYEFTRLDLSRHDFEPQGKCDNGRHEMSSSESFGVYVWGWGTPETRAGLSPACGVDLPGNTCDISYGYPAGESVHPINVVHVSTDPR